MNENCDAFHSTWHLCGEAWRLGFMAAGRGRMAHHTSHVLCALSSVHVAKQQNADTSSSPQCAPRKVTFCPSSPSLAPPTPLPPFLTPCVTFRCRGIAKSVIISNGATSQPFHCRACAPTPQRWEICGPRNAHVRYPTVDGCYLITTWASSPHPPSLHRLAR